MKQLAPALLLRYGSDWLYGMGGCEEARLTMPFSGTVPSGTRVTFTASPAHINGEDCAPAQPPVPLTVEAP